MGILRKSAIFVTVITLFISCNADMSRQGGINQNIFPYIKLVESDDETYCTAQIVEGAAVESLDIPGMVHSAKGAIPIAEFLGYEDSIDALSLKRLKMDASTHIGQNVFKQMENIRSIEMTGIEENSIWQLPESMTENDQYHFCKWQAGDSVVSNGYPADPEYPIAVAVYEKHIESWLTDSNCHRLGCPVCNFVFGDKEKHQFQNVGNEEVCVVCGYVKNSIGGSGGFDVDLKNMVPEGHLTATEAERNVWLFRFNEDQIDEKYHSSVFEWYVGNVLQTETGSEFRFVLDGKRSYTVMCVFKNAYGVGSDSIYVIGK